MKPTKWSGILCILLIFFNISCSEDPEIKYKRLVKEGDTAFHSYEYNSALSLWLQANNIQNNKPDLNEKIGKVYLRLADYDLAKLFFKKALFSDPQAWRSRLELARLELKTQDYDSAEKNWAALKDQSNFPEVLVFRGDLHLFNKNYKEAEKAYKRALTVDDEFKAGLVRLAICYLFQGKNKEADEIYTKLEKGQFNDPELLAQTGKLWKLQGNDEKAERYLKRASETAPDDLTYKRELAEYYYSEGRHEQAYIILKDMHLKSPGNRYVIKFLVDTLMLLNRLKEANEFMVSLPQGALEDLEWNLLKAKYYLLSGEPYNAIAHYSSVIGKEPNFPAAHYSLALAYLAAGQSNLAQKSAVKALALNPEYIEAELLLADIYYKRKEYDISLEHALRIVKKAPENYRAHLITGNLYLVQKQYDNALIKFATVRRLKPELITPLYSMALTYELTGMTEEALKLYQQTMELDPKNLDVAIRYALLMQKENNNEQALDTLDSLIVQNPENGRLYQVSGDIFWNMNDLENSERCFKKAIELQPTLISGYFRLKDVYERNGNKEGLVQTLQQCISYNPTYPYAHIELAKFFESDGNTLQAQQVLQEALKANPGSPYLENSLAWFYLEHEMNIDEAYLMAQRAYEKLPEDPAITDTLGWAYYKKNSLTRAVWILNDALKLDQNNPLILYHLGVVHAARDEIAVAEKVLQKALDIGLSEKNNQKAQALLQTLKDKKNG